MNDQNERCPQCDAVFECGAQSPQGCWCMALQVVATEQLPAGVKDAELRCLCPRCLEECLKPAENL